MTCLIDAIDMNLTFNEQTVRVFVFVLKDICQILGLSNPSKTLENVDKDYHLSLEVRGGNSSGIQQTLVVREAGLYQVIMRCRKEVAKPFQRHFTSMTLFSEETGICRNSIPLFRDVLCVANGFLWTSETKMFTEEDLNEACKNCKTFRQNLSEEEHKEIYNRYVNDEESKKDLMLEYDISDTQFKRIISQQKLK